MNIFECKQISLVSPNNFEWLNVIFDLLINKSYNDFSSDGISKLLELNRIHRIGAEKEGRKYWYYVLSIDNEDKSLIFANFEMDGDFNFELNESNFQSILNQIKEL